MAKTQRKTGTAKQAPGDTIRVAIGCQGGGMHAAFEVGVLGEILRHMHDDLREDKKERKRIELVGLSGTSAGALCALTVWYALAPKNGKTGAPLDAARQLDRFWEEFVAGTDIETALNSLTYGAFRAEELEIFGVNAPTLARLSPYGAIFRALADSLPSLGVRRSYFDLEYMLDRTCPDFDSIKWGDVETRLLIGATEVINGFETVFDSNVNRKAQKINEGMQSADKDMDKADFWRQRLPLTLSGIAASGTLPVFREAQRIKGGYYWDGLYSQNPPVREFFASVDKNEVPDELWILRINPQQWPYAPETNKDIQDRQNELMGNLSLNKELNSILTVNKWINDKVISGGEFKTVTIRTIKMRKRTADELAYSSKFNRSRNFVNTLRQEGIEVARGWLDQWDKNTVGEYPQDAAY